MSLLLNFVPFAPPSETRQIINLKNNQSKKQSNDQDIKIQAKTAIFCHQKH